MFLTDYDKWKKGLDDYVDKRTEFMFQKRFEKEVARARQEEERMETHENFRKMVFASDKSVEPAFQYFGQAAVQNVMRKHGDLPIDQAAPLVAKEINALRSSAAYSPQNGATALRAEGAQPAGAPTPSKMTPGEAMSFKKVG